MQRMTEDQLMIDTIAARNEKIRLDPTDVKSYLYLFSLYLGTEAYEEAIYNIEKIIQLEPKNAMRYSQRGVAYEMQGNLDEAISNFNKALELALNNIKRALNDVELALYNIDAALLYCNRGDAYEKKGMTAKAILDYTKAIQLNPKESHYKSLESAISQRDKISLFNLIKTLPIDEQIFLLEPCSGMKKPRHRQRNLLRDYFWKNEWFSSDIIRDITDHVETLKKQASSEAKERLKEAEEPIEANDNAGSKYSIAAQINQHIANAAQFEIQNKVLCIIAAYNQAIRLGTDNSYQKDLLARIYNYRGSFYLKNKIYDEAIYDYSEAIKIDSNCAMAYLNRGYTHEILKNPNEAIADFKQALKLKKYIHTEINWDEIRKKMQDLVSMRALTASGYGIYSQNFINEENSDNDENTNDSELCNGIYDV